MKKYTIIIIFSFIAMTACESLDIAPDGRLTMGDVWTDPIKSEAYLNRAYLSIPSYFNTYGFFELLSGTTDESIYRHRGRATSGWVTGYLNPTENYLNPFYGTFWTGIRDCNVFINNVDESAIESIDIKKRLKAEAKVLRAFYYFELIKQYGPMPIVIDELLVDFDYTTLERPTFQENTDFIVKELKEAIAESSLPMRLTNENERKRMSKAVAYALMSEALLYNASPLWNPTNDIEKWRAAAEGSKEAVTKLEEYDYELFPDYEEYYQYTSDLRNDPKDKQTIYETYGYSVAHLYLHQGIPSNQASYSSGACPSQELVDSYNIKSTGEMPILGYEDASHLNPIINAESLYDPENPYLDRDPRFYASVLYNGTQLNIGGNQPHTVETFVGGTDEYRPIEIDIENYTVTGYYLRKFIDPNIRIGTGFRNASWKKFHFSKVLLNLAEAENEANGPTSIAYSAVNKVRRRVNMHDLPSSLSKDEFRNRIRNERRVELAFEEDRFWDVRRWKIMDKTDKVTTGMVITKDENNNFNYNRVVVKRRETWQDKFLIYPIPVGETAKVPNFADNQNPGW